MRILTYLFICFFISNSSFAQDDLEFWPYTKHALKERRVINHRHTSESAVRYHKRIQRVIDLREKQNLPMVWPKSSLNAILECAIMEDDCGHKQLASVAYRSEDSLKNGIPYSRKELKERGSYVATIPIIDSLGNTDVIEQIVPLDFKSIKKYRIIEDWIFDHKHSDFRPRIIALAPVIEQMAGGNMIGETALCWFMMEDLRPVFVNKEVFNPGNGAARLSFDDWFEMRMFSSYIIKEPNVWNYKINEIPEYEDDGIAALLKADMVKNDLFIFEHDHWSY